MAAFPFTVYPSAVGHGALSASDGSKPKGAKREVAEMWLPLWERPASLTEVQQLLAEGRIMIGRRQARTGVDVARAVAGLGIDRGLVAFQRIAFLMRNGQSFLATSLGRFEVGRRREVDLLHQLDAWVERFRRACRVGQRDEAPARFTRALRRIDAAIFDVARYGGTQRMAEILCAMGQAERELATGEQFRATRGVDPIPPLTPDWIVACDDGTVEFRLALALASIRGDREGRMAPLRGHLEAVERLGMRWQWAVGNRAVVWSEADLCRNLTAVLTRRLMDAGRMGLDRPSLAGRVTVTLPDVAAFLGRATDDRRITELLWGLILVDERRPWSAYRPPSVPQQSLWHLLPRAYALLKLVFLPAPLVARVDSQGRHQVSLDWTGEVGVAVKPEPEILGRLKSGDVDQACQIAARRLRAAGFVPMPGPTASGRRRVVTFSTRQMDGTRLAAALMFPVANITRMARLVLRPTVDDPAGSR
jgi:CRISPR-associated protein Csx17